MNIPLHVLSWAALRKFVATHLTTGLNMVEGDVACAMMTALQKVETAIVDVSPGIGFYCSFASLQSTAAYSCAS